MNWGNLSFTVPILPNWRGMPVPVMAAVKRAAHTPYILHMFLEIVRAYICLTRQPFEKISSVFAKGVTDIII